MAVKHSPSMAQSSEKEPRRSGRVSRCTYRVLYHSKSLSHRCRQSARLCFSRWRGRPGFQRGPWYSFLSRWRCPLVSESRPFQSVQGPKVCVCQKYLLSKHWCRRRHSLRTISCRFRRVEWSQFRTQLMKQKLWLESYLSTAGLRWFQTAHEKWCWSHLPSLLAWNFRHWWMRLQVRL